MAHDSREVNLPGIMARDKVSETSKKLSWLLRHGAGEAGLRMDAAGWASVDDVLRKIHMDMDTLLRAVAENNKARIEVQDGRIRACQGHSTEGMPVTCEALEATWARHEGAGPLWHGTSADAVPSILREGIRSVGRTHVHLAEATDSKVGKRAQVDVLIEVSVPGLLAAGLGVFQSSNGVVLVRHVPPSCITGLVPQTRAGRARQGELTALLQARA
jgi:putative RNA 2'-phosphotransferase